MSRIGKSPVALPKGVEVSVSKGNLVTVNGPKGQLSEQLDVDITVSIEDGQLNVLRPTESKRHRSMHGLYRALVNNMVEGVTKGFVKEMEVIGVGYRVANTGQLLELTIGYSHPILFALPEEVKLSTAMEKGKSPLIRMECIDKQLLGQVAAKIRAFRKPEPYKGKGIRFVGEIVRRKAGKTAGKK
ncbi:MAG: 50S ribosomal protein L6 [Saprospiraceae bacterium]|nr:50S ribosomal protein L6 [Saprospiraceae bacterium]